jgi:hypothetical protein
LLRVRVPSATQINLTFAIADCRFPFLQTANLKSKIENSAVPVAQPDRASDFGSEGWGFESLQARVV